MPTHRTREIMKQRRLEARERHLDNGPRFGPPELMVTGREFIALQKRAASGDAEAAQQVRTVNGYMVEMGRALMGGN